MLRYLYFLFLLLLAPVDLVFAAETANMLSLQASPALFEFEIEPEQERMESLSLVNLSSTPMPVETRLAPFSEDESGKVIFTEDIDLKNWFSIEKPYFILAPKEKQEIFFRLKVPKTARPGSYFLMIIFEPKISQAYYKAQSPKILPLIGVPVLISVGRPNFKEAGGFQITEFFLDQKSRLTFLEKIIKKIGKIVPAVQAADLMLVEKAPIKFLLNLKNNGIFHRRVPALIQLFDSRGSLVGKLGLKSETILPGRTKILEAEFLPDKKNFFSLERFKKKNLFWGQYKAAVYLLNPKNNSAEVGRLVGILEPEKTELTFWVFPWRFMLSTGLFLALACLVIQLKQKIVKALRVMIKGKNEAIFRIKLNN